MNQPRFADYWQGTVRHALHDWQVRFLAPMIERWASEEGVRLLIHAPPQYGKSEGVSQRGPAYALGINPRERVLLASYNQDHAATFGATVRALLRGDDFARWFPSTASSAAVRSDSKAASWNTAARVSLRGSQHSFTAAGLVTGVTGLGFGKVIIDDPYRSPRDAESKAVNEAVWQFWRGILRPRLPERASIIVMFHRYHVDDLAGRMLNEGFEYTRFPAIADGNEDGADPTGRAPGELLSPMRTREELEAERASNPYVFAGQFQGVPTLAGGEFIRRAWLRETQSVPRIERIVRFWDLSVGRKQTGDWTAGALVGIGPDQTVYLLDMVRFRAQWGEAGPLIAATTERDLIRAEVLGAHYAVGVERVFWQDAMIQDLFRMRVFERVRLIPMPARGDKKARANGWVLRARFDQFRIVPGGWDVAGFIDEAVVFDGLGRTHDDQIDAVSGAYQLLWWFRSSDEGTNEEPEINTHGYTKRLRELASDARGGELPGWDDDD